ncbi:hypothetical protein E4U13_007336 [Claviceps humidiphila]|uniref:Uncharacterized protein n=1 Tax=Claviceps humidiphila TaxID=1294629 RepID=A0A9P7PVM9_9HYPO|nr:hypothetical protein E4U13_007336 [Claviceps humidiphila]
MQLLSALAVAFAASVASAAPYSDVASDKSVREVQPKYRWCNHGTAGNNGCEENGLHTYCCIYIETLGPHPYFNIWRTVTVTSRNPEGSIHCENGGFVYCSA